MKNILVASLLILTGCATGSHIITGTVPPAIAANDMKIYSAILNCIIDSAIGPRLSVV